MVFTYIFNACLNNAPKYSDGNFHLIRMCKLFLKFFGNSHIQKVKPIKTWSLGDCPRIISTD